MPGVTDDDSDPLPILLLAVCCLALGLFVGFLLGLNVR
jgi:hypothetical protein